jgi:hypothetical protein
MDIEEQSLTAILDGTPAETSFAEPTPAPEPTPEPEANADGRPRDPETGKFVKTGEEEPTPGNPIPDDQFKGYLTEKRKRQDAEERAAELERQLQSIQQPQAQPAPPPSVWDDEQAYGQHLTGRAVSEASFNAQLNTSEMLCRDKFDDFDDKKAKFLEMAQANPVIVQQALADPHPWRRAYQIASNATRIEELGATDLDTLEAKLREKIMAEMQGSEPVRQQQSLPPTLTTERNVGVRTGPAWAGPPSLGELLR